MMKSGCVHSVTELKSAHLMFYQKNYPCLSCNLTKIFRDFYVRNCKITIEHQLKSEWWSLLCILVNLFSRKLFFRLCRVFTQWMIHRYVFSLMKKRYLRTGWKLREWFNWKREILSSKIPLLKGCFIDLLQLPFHGYGWITHTKVFPN